MWAWLTRWLRPAVPSRPPVQPVTFVDPAVYDKWREANRRPLWLPVTQAGQLPGSASRFGGVPDLAADELWPRCPHCRATMPLFLQLDVASLPAGAPMQVEVGGGLVQLFGCTNCGALSEDGSAVARLLPPAARQPAVMDHDTNLLTPRSIVGWQRYEQLPTGSEWDGDDLPDDEPEEAQAPWEDHHGYGRDKLGGWPSWVQYAEYPACPTCQRPQRLLFQIASEEGLDFMFGDVGTAYLLYCSHHADQLAFSWQCT
ncbi:DUF1963 domain-containing protein [Hymenobacter jeollabukensis]|uniref:DUF1963 domain-containing protein n=1 Tax=Hymenobacter jeollabukensis TaxID=2025313 RepID=A0A5R8WQW2_9BACT|nr:DUF1963 domain-containing protein [Hymenobacter jeollabukensis]TLM93119.1 DUF1963 domain-containing protein [Hymenobacter jeollabukensis]